MKNAGVIIPAFLVASSFRIDRGVIRVVHWLGKRSTPMPTRRRLVGAVSPKTFLFASGPNYAEAESSASCNAVFGRTPTKLSDTSPPLNNNKVGMLLMPKR